MRYFNRSIKDCRGVHDGSEKTWNAADLAWKDAEVIVEFKHLKRTFQCFCRHHLGMEICLYKIDTLLMDQTKCRRKPAGY